MRSIILQIHRNTPAMESLEDFSKVEVNKIGFDKVSPEINFFAQGFLFVLPKKQNFLVLLGGKKWKY